MKRLPVTLFAAVVIAGAGCASSDEAQQDIWLEDLEATWDGWNSAERSQFCGEYNNDPAGATATLTENGLYKSTLIEFLTGRCI